MNPVTSPTTVPCKFCGDPTPMLGTKQCDGCWEIRSRVRHLNGPQLQKLLTDAGFAVADGYIFAPKEFPSSEPKPPRRDPRELGKAVASMVVVDFDGLEDDYRQDVVEEALVHWSILVGLSYVEETHETVKEFTRGVEDFLNEVEAETS